MKPKILVIVGPTASGKTSLSIKLARALGGEIVSADSRQVYKELNLASGKVTKREMLRVPHRMLDVVSLKKRYSVAEYKRDAEKIINEIIACGKLPIIVGGTGQYIDAITKGLIVPEVPPNHSLRKKLKNVQPEELYKTLRKLDPKRAKNIDKHNPVRLIRAIEIAQALGKVPKLISGPKYSPIIIGIKIDSEKLKQNIHRRLISRIKSGMINEIKNIHNSGISWKKLEGLGLEMKYISLYLQKKLTKQEMLAQLETAILQYSKRQMTWFKRDKLITWVTNPGPSLFLRIRSQLL
jgi:tRNA dimethylallyltransferase